jgi:hypothetical protein
MEDSYIQANMDDVLELDNEVSWDRISVPMLVQLENDPILAEFAKALTMKGIAEDASASRRFLGPSAAHVEKDADGIDVLPGFRFIISLKVRGLYPKTPPWLVDRIADMVTRRRQYFYYQRKHMASRRAKHPTIGQSDFQPTSSPIVPSKPMTKVDQSEPTNHDVNLKERNSPAVRQATSSRESMRTSTMASELVLDDGKRINQSSAKPMPTEMWMGESIFPNPPKSGDYKTFECSQCFEKLP